MSSFRYRRDIDGLRAVAVIAVLFFHLKPEWLPGGYVGVDVFFVISGYLITSIIYAEQRAKQIESEYNDYKEKVKAAETNSPNYAGEDIEVAPICTLKSVTTGTRTNRRGQNIRCTYFDFEEDVPTRVMDAWADPDGSKTEKARLLIDKQVMTTTWKPEIFNPLKWCRNIYDASEF